MHKHAQAIIIKSTQYINFLMSEYLVDNLTFMLDSNKTFIRMKIRTSLIKKQINNWSGVTSYGWCDM